MYKTFIYLELVVITFLLISTLKETLYVTHFRTEIKSTYKCEILELEHIYDNFMVTELCI